MSFWWPQCTSNELWTLCVFFVVLSVCIACAHACPQAVWFGHNHKNDLKSLRRKVHLWARQAVWCSCCVFTSFFSEKPLLKTMCDPGSQLTYYMFASLGIFHTWMGGLLHKNGYLLNWLLQLLSTLFITSGHFFYLFFKYHNSKKWLYFHTFMPWLQMARSLPILRIRVPNLVQELLRTYYLLVLGLQLDFPEVEAPSTYLQSILFCGRRANLCWKQTQLAGLFFWVKLHSSRDRKS